MMMFVILVMLSICSAHAESEVSFIRLVPGAEMGRAEIYTWKPHIKPKAIMVFCPGHNGSAEGFVKAEAWRKFAEENHVGLCGISFASNMSLTEQGKGYSYAERGSGQILLDAIGREFGWTELPLLLYGYSAGARFTTSLLACKPERILGWCASGVGTWPALPKDLPGIAPGIVACGEFDAACYWSSLHYFQSGREKNYPWIWVSLKDLGHGYSSVLDQFVVDYFVLRLKSKGERIVTKKPPVVLDIATERRLDPDSATFSRIFSASLPADEALIEQWTRIHHP